MLPVPQALLDAMQGLVAEVRAVLLSGRRGASSSARQEALLAAVKRLHVHRIKVGADPLPTWVAAVVSRGQTGWPACLLACLLAMLHGGALTSHVVSRNRRRRAK
jgi:hypothetical protein